MPVNCCVFGCISSSLLKTKHSFHTMPRDNERKKQWLKAIPKTNGNYCQMYVCSLHFTPDDYSVPGTTRKTDTPVLKRTAVPSRNLIPNRVYKSVIIKSVKPKEKTEKELQQIERELEAYLKKREESLIVPTEIKEEPLEEIAPSKQNVVVKDPLTRCPKRTQQNSTNKVQFITEDLIKTENEIKTETDVTDSIIIANDESFLELAPPVIQKEVYTNPKVKNIKNGLQNLLSNPSLVLNETRFKMCNVTLNFKSSKENDQNKQDFYITFNNKTAVTNNVGLTKELLENQDLDTTFKIVDEEHFTDNVEVTEEKEIESDINIKEDTGNQNIAKDCNDIEMVTDETFCIKIEDDEEESEIITTKQIYMVDPDGDVLIKMVDTSKPLEEDHYPLCIHCHTTFDSYKELDDHLYFYKNKRDPETNSDSTLNDKKTRPKRPLCSNIFRTTDKCMCEFCGHICENKYKLASHVNRLHTPDELKEKFFCEICARMFTDEKYLNKHKKEVHVKSRDFKCNKCPKDFKSHNSLRIHKFMCHTDPSKWKHECIHCKKRFSQKPNMIAHMRVHFRNNKKRKVTEKQKNEQK